jgi:hypothetical protein
MPQILGIIGTFLATNAPAIGAASAIAGAGTTIGSTIYNDVSSPSPTTAAPTPAPTPQPTQVNPGQAYQALANQQSQNPYANTGLQGNLLSQLFGVGAGQPITTGGGFTPTGAGAGTTNSVTPQTTSLSDLINQVMGG